MSRISARSCRLVFADKDKLVCLSYDLRMNTFRKISTAPVRNVRYLTKSGDVLIAASKQQIVRLNRDFTKIVSRSSVTGAICMDSGCVYVAQPTRLSILNDELKIVGSVALPLPEIVAADNEIDSVLIHKHIAYLSGHFQDLGIWSRRVDVADGENMRALDGDIVRESMIDISEGPDSPRSLQFIDPKANHWVLTRDHFNVAGVDQELSIRPLEQRRNKDILFMTKKSRRKCRRRVRGYRLVDVMKVPPLWAVIQDRKNNVFLAKIETKSNRISFGQLTLLETVDKAKAFSLWSYSDIEEFSFSLRKHNNIAFVCEVTLDSEAPKECIPFHKVDLDRRIRERTQCFNLADFGLRNVYDFMVF